MTRVARTTAAVVMTSAITLAVALPAVAAAPSTVISGRLGLKRSAPSGIVQAGRVSVTGLGVGTLTARSVQQATVSSYRTHTTLRLRGGSITFSGTNYTRVSKNDNALYALHGTARIVSGTGRYGKASGSFRVTGTGALNLTWLNLKLVGRLSS